MRTSRQIAFVILLVTISSNGKARAGAPVLDLCHLSNQSAAERAFRNPALVAFYRALTGLTPSEASTQWKLRSGECRERPPFTCFARPGELGCREEALEQILLAAAWSAAFITLDPARTGDPGAESGLDLGMSPDQLVELVSTAIRNPGQLDRQIEQARSSSPANGQVFDKARALVQHLPAMEDDNQRIANASAEQKLMLALYHDLSGAVLSFLIGHEYTHYLSNRCPIDAQSAVERTGIIETLRKLQAGKTPLCFQPVAPAELSADICGLRVLERFERLPMRPIDRLPPGLRTVSRRAAVELLTWILAQGTPFTEQAPLTAATPAADTPRDYSVKFGYLYTPFRVLLFSQVLREMEPPSSAWAIGPCGSSLFVVMREWGYAQTWCIKDRKERAARRADFAGLINLFGAMMPPSLRTTLAAGQSVRPDDLRCRAAGSRAP